IEIVLLHLERVGQLNVLQRPTACAVFEIVAAILQPDANILPVAVANQKWENVAAIENISGIVQPMTPICVGLSSTPLERCEASNAGKNSSKGLRPPPRSIQ